MNSGENNSKKIAIFVSHRIDLKSMVIDNPLYVPVRCGAALDENDEGNVIMGDNTGDNISEKRISFCEYTVQYWAWKNYDADYYGLCHYRRYLSFMDSFMPGNDYDVRMENNLSVRTAELYQLFNKSKMEKEISSYDVIVGKAFDTTKITRVRPRNSVKELWYASRNLVDPIAIDTLIKIIEDRHPELVESMNEYFASKYYRGYNCFVMSKKIFNEYNKVLFDILFEFDKQFDTTGYEGNKLRATGYMGEIVYGVYMWYLQHHTDCKFLERQIVYFKNTEADPDANTLAQRTLSYKKPNDDIKIFVSHRMDLDSAVIGNHIFENYKCNAGSARCFLKMNGDDTGDNISDLAKYFSELSVQYWAWKNANVNYYGLCHYRRYLSFSNKKFDQCSRGYIIENMLNDESIEKYGLNDYDNMAKQIKKYDLITGGSMDVDEMDFLFGGKRAHCIKDIFMIQEHLFDKSAPELTLKLVDELYPEYSKAAEEYMASKKYYAYNCFVMSKELFNRFCTFEFGVLFEFIKRFDLSKYQGTKMRTPGYMSEVLYGIFIYWVLKQRKYKVKENQLVFFRETNAAKCKVTPVKTAATPKKPQKVESVLKKIMRNTFPAYRVALRNEERLGALVASVNDLQKKSTEHSVLLARTVKVCQSAASKSVQAAVAKSPIIATSLRKDIWDAKTLTSNINLNIACLANEIHETHKKSFGEFRNINTGRDVVVMASGPSMRYYKPIPGAVHIGMNASFLNPDVDIDYYFTTDYESRAPWFEKLKEYDFVKFFGQYSTGEYRDKFQVSEKIIRENNGRRFFQAAPSEDIHINIEFYPLMAFYSIAFQAIHFALFTNAKRIYLVGCDCTNAGYFDGSKQRLSDLVAKTSVPHWLDGYQKVKAFVERFYPDTEIISVNPMGLRGLYSDVYTDDFIADHPEIDSSKVTRLNSTQEEK